MSAPSPSLPLVATESVRLTAFSHGAGCGCKLSPAVLDQLLRGVQASSQTYPNLIVGNADRDDAAVYDLGNDQLLISTTDFFLPIVDDAVEFGRIASANAISDVYAMGGRPILAIAILAWPIDKLSPEVGGQVLSGARALCDEAGIPLAGGHSIDAPEPIFGLAVNGLVSRAHLKTNAGARAGDLLLLTKPLGIGLYTTAEKKGLLLLEHRGEAARWMTRLNSLGEALGRVAGVTALTDVTGFGLLGHLSEMCRAANLSATVNAERVPQLPGAAHYIAQGCVPGGTTRNWASYGSGISLSSDAQRPLLADPQTSGGLLIAVSPDALGEVQALLRAQGLGEFTEPIGQFGARAEALVSVV